MSAAILFLLVLALIDVAVAGRRLPRQAALALPPALLGMAAVLGAAGLAQLDGAEAPARWAGMAALGGALPLLALQVGWQGHSASRDLPAALALVLVGTLLAALPDHGWWAQLLAALAALTIAVRAPLVCRLWGAAGAMAIGLGLALQAVDGVRWGVSGAALGVHLGLTLGLLCLQRCLPNPARRRRPR